MLVALDLETTGLDPRKDKIIEIAALRMTPAGEILEEFHTLVQPHTPLPPLITHLTGITDEDLKDAPSWNDVAESVREFLGDLPILGHSVQFDVDFLTYSGGLTLEKNTVLDTFELAQTLLPKESSYSLEILSEKYQLPHPNKHRAIDDTRVAIELYKFLTETLRTLTLTNPEDLDTLKSILHNSDWTWKTHVLDHLPSVSSQTSNPLSSKVQQQPAQPEKAVDRALKTFLLEKLAHHASAIVEAPFYTTKALIDAAVEAHDASGERILIATDRLNDWPSDPRVGHLHHPGIYRCRTQWDNLLKQSHFSASEARLITKNFLWGNEEGLKTSFAINESEQGAWNRISAYPHLGNTQCTTPECPYRRARARAEHVPVLLVPTALLIENIGEQRHLIPHRDSLVVDQAEGLESTAITAFTRYFAIEHLTPYTTPEQESTLTVLFGLLGLMLEKYAPPDAYRQQLELTEETRFIREWKQVESLIEKLTTPEEGTPFLDPERAFVSSKKCQALTKALKPHPQMLTWITARLDGTPVVQSAPLNLGGVLKSHLWAHHPTHILVSGFGTLKGDFQYIKERLHLDPHLEEKNLAETPSTPGLGTARLIPHRDLLDPHSPKNLGQTVTLLKTWFAEQHRENRPPHAFLLTNSLKAAEQLHHKLAGLLKEQGVDLLTQGMSGGIGKILQRAHNNPDHTVLMGTEKLYSAFLKSPSATTLTTLFIHRLPFLPPPTPVHKKEEDQAPNAFVSHSLPRAILRFKQFLYEGLSAAPLEEIHLLDSRWNNYNGAFPESVKALITL